MFCQYYQAVVNVAKTWFIGGFFKSEDYVAFERTINGSSDVIEFFVPEDQEEFFLELMSCLQRNGYVDRFEKMPNRLQFPERYKQ